MAKPISQRDGGKMAASNPQIPSLAVAEPIFWSPPKGLDLRSRLSRVAKENTVDSKNLVLTNGTQESRLGTTMLDLPQPHIMALINYVNPFQTGFLIRVTTTGIEKWTGTTWVAVATNIFNGSDTDYFSSVGFGSEVLLVNGVDKIYRYNPSTGENAFISAAPSAKHINVFAGRVIATDITSGGRKAARVQWSVKNNDLDWTGDGSGFEDLYSAPGGRVDQAYGCFPITDDTAFLIRETSVWQMTVTGQVLTPFRFSLLFPEVGTKARRSVAQVPGGYIMLTREDVVIMTIGGIESIGSQIRDELFESITDMDAVIGKYDHNRNEYRLAVGPRVWRYSMREQGWTRDDYPLSVRDMTLVEFSQTGLTIDSLAGTIDALAGTIDELVGAFSLGGFFFVQFDSHTSVILYEDPASLTDQGTSVVPEPDTILDDFLTAGAGLLTAYVPPVGDHYTGFNTSAMANDWNTAVGAVIVPISTSANRTARIKELFVAGPLVAKIAVRQDAGTTFVTSFGVMLCCPDAAQTDNEGIGVGFFSDAFPGGATFHPKIIVYNAIGPTVTIRATGDPIALLPATEYYCRITVDDIVSQIVLEMSTTGIDGPWTVVCTYASTVDEQAFYNDGTHRHVGLLGQTADFGTTPWRFNYMQFAPTEQVSVGPVPAPILLTTGILSRTTPYEGLILEEIELEYESLIDHILIFEYSVDAGVTWLAYDTQTIHATAGPMTMFVRKTVRDRNIQLRIRSATLGQLSVISLLARTTQAPRQLGIGAETEGGG